MEHTIPANGIRQGRTGGLVLSQLHIGLAVGFAIVACLTAFGGGMIVGMWYKASEQSPLSSTAVTATATEPPAQGQDTEDHPNEPLAPVTFYNTLTNSNMAYAPLTPPPVPSTTGSAKGAVAPAPAAGTANGGKAAVPGSTPARAAATSGTTNGTQAATAPKATPSAASTVRTAVVRESQKQTKATSVPKTGPTEAAVSPAGPRTAAQKSAAPVRQAGKETGTQRLAGATATAKVSGAEDGRGPGGRAETAERLRTNPAHKGSQVRVPPAATPGQDPPYRVRVGSYSERTAADQTAQHLTAREQVPAIVAGRD